MNVVSGLLLIVWFSRTVSYFKSSIGHFWQVAAQQQAGLNRKDVLLLSAAANRPRSNSGRYDTSTRIIKIIKIHYFHVVYQALRY